MEQIEDKVGIWYKVQELGIEYASHESDLYIPVNEQTEELIKNYMFKKSVGRFINNIDKKLWFDIPFAYIPFWDNRCKNLVVNVTREV
jgi:hypothetical protein